MDTIAILERLKNSEVRGNIFNPRKELLWPDIDGAIKEVKRLQSDLTVLKKIADFAFDIHTRDPVNVKKKWGVCGVKAEEKLCEMIESQKKGS